MTGLSDGESISTISLAILTQHRSVTDGQTDGDGRNCTVNIARCINKWTNVETVVLLETALSCQWRPALVVERAVRDEVKTGQWR